MSTTFHCPFCGAPITGPAPGVSFACPYCRAKVMAPYDGATGPQGAARWDGGASEAREYQQGPFTTDVDDLAVAVDPQLGPIAIGAFAPHGKPAVLRAWDMKAKKPLWEQLSGSSWLENLRGQGMRVIGRNVYIANKRQLLCLDLMKGDKKWQAALSDTPAGNEEDGIDIADPFPPGQRGAILVATVDHQVFAFDRDSGQPLWNRPFKDSADLEPVPGLGAVVVRHNGSFVKADILNPAFPQSIASLGGQDWSTDVGRCKVAGRTVLTCVTNMGPENDEEGLFCFDAVTGQVHFFDRVEDLETDVVPCAIGPRAFAAVDSGNGLYVGPRGRPMPVPVPNHTIAALVQAGPTLMLLLKKAQGTPIRRIVGIDPNTLAFRFDAGEAGGEPSDDWDRQLATDGYSVVFVAGDDDSDLPCEVRSIDTSTGRQLWKRPFVRYRRHKFAGGAVVVHGYDHIEVLSPQNGQLIASIP